MLLSKQMTQNDKVKEDTYVEDDKGDKQSSNRRYYIRHTLAWILVVGFAFVSQWLIVAYTVKFEPKYKTCVYSNFDVGLGSCSADHENNVGDLDSCENIGQLNWFFTICRSFILDVILFEPFKMLGGTLGMFWIIATSRTKRRRKMRRTTRKVRKVVQLRARQKEVLAARKARLKEIAVKKTTKENRMKGLRVQLGGVFSKVKFSNRTNKKVKVTKKKLKEKTKRDKKHVLPERHIKAATKVVEVTLNTSDRVVIRKSIIHKKKPIDLEVDFASMFEKRGRSKRKTTKVKGFDLSREETKSDKAATKQAVLASGDKNEIVALEDLDLEEDRTSAAAQPIAPAPIQRQKSQHIGKKPNICFAFKFGKCSRGDECPLLHDK